MFRMCLEVEYNLLLQTEMIYQVIFQEENNKGMLLIII